MHNINEISNVLIDYVHRGLFTNVWYYIKSFSKVSIILYIDDIRNDQNEIVGVINHSGFVGINSEVIEIKLPVSTSIKKQWSENSNRFYFETVINDGTTFGLTDYYPELEDSFIECDEYYIPALQQSIMLLLFNHNLFEDFFDEVRKLLYKSDTSSEIQSSYNYGFNFDLEYPDGDELKRQLFLDFDYDEFDVFIKFLPRKSTDFVLKNYRKIIYSSARVINKHNSRGLNPMIINSLDYLEERFLIEGKLDGTLIIQYHASIEDIFREILKVLKSLIKAIFHDKRDLLDKKTLKQLYIISEQKDSHINLHEIARILDIVFSHNLKAIKPFNYLTNIKDYIKKSEFISSISTYSNFRNQLAHSNTISHDEKTMRLIISSYRGMISFLLDILLVFNKSKSKEQAQ